MQKQQGPWGMLLFLFSDTKNMALNEGDYSKRVKANKQIRYCMYSENYIKLK
jgi:hypothetical protein